MKMTICSPRMSCTIFHIYLGCVVIDFALYNMGASVSQALTYLLCYVTNLGVDMARFTQFPLMIPRWAIIYKIISPGATGSSI